MVAKMTDESWFDIARLTRTWRNDLPRDQQLEHCALGLQAEVGELVGAIHKAKFKDAPHGLKKRIEAEVGDCLYYLQMAAYLSGYPPMQKPARVAPMQRPESRALVAISLRAAEVATDLLTGAALTIGPLADRLLSLAAEHGATPDDVERINASKLADGHRWVDVSD